MENFDYQSILVDGGSIVHWIHLNPVYRHSKDLTWLHYRKRTHLFHTAIENVIR